MTGLQCLLCDNLKCETRDAAANPDCQAQQNQEVWCWMGQTAKLCFTLCKTVVSVQKRKQECSILQQQNGSYFSFHSTAQSVEIQQHRPDGVTVTSNREISLIWMWRNLSGCKLSKKPFIHNLCQLFYLQRQGFFKNCFYFHLLYAYSETIVLINFTTKFLDK